MKSLSWLIVAQRALICFTSVFVLSLSCSDNSLSHSCSDPLGSEDIILSRCDSTQNWDRCYFCFGGEEINGTDTCYFNKCFKLYSDIPSSDWIIWSWHFAGGCMVGTIIDVGEVACLGDVNNKPSSGFVYKVTPKANHGYVVSFPDGTYGRFFIQAALKNSAGRDSTIHMTRQYPF